MVGRGYNVSSRRIFGKIDLTVYYLRCKEKLYGTGKDILNLRFDSRDVY